MEDRLLSAKEAAKVICIAKSTFWKWSREGKLPKPQKFGNRCTRWRMSELLEIVKNGINENK